MIKQATTPTRLLSRLSSRRLKTAVLICPVVLFSLLFHVSSASASAKAKRDIRSVDFRNFTFPVPCGKQKTLTLKEGKVPAEGCYDITKLVSLSYRDLNGGQQEEAIIVIGTNCKASCWYIEDYLVYSYRHGRLTPIFKEQQSYRYGLVEPDDFSKNVWGLPRPYSLSVKRKGLIITGLAWDEGDGTCCPRYRERTVYGWRRNRFAIISRERAFDPNGPGDPRMRK